MPLNPDNHAFEAQALLRHITLRGPLSVPAAGCPWEWASGNSEDSIWVSIKQKSFQYSFLFLKKNLKTKTKTNLREVTITYVFYTNLICLQHNNE